MSTKILNGLSLDRATGQPNIKGIGEGNIVIDALDASHNVYLNNYVGGDVILATGGGNVGIGTTSPSVKLDVNGGGHSTPFRVLSTNTTSLRTFLEATSGNVEQHFLYTGNQDWVLGLDKADSSKFKLSSADDGFASAKLTVTTSGNVGIGTTSPSSANGFDAKLQLESANPMLVYKETDQTTKWEVGAWGGNYVVYNGTNERMRITSSGNIGIGTTSPQSVGAAWTTLEVQGNSTGGGGVIYTANNGASVKSHFYSDGTGGYIGTQTNQFFAFTSNNTERMRITSAGGISFGSTGTAYGTSGQVLTSAGNASPTWTTPTTGTVTGTGVTGEVAYWTSSTNIANNAGMRFINEQLQLDGIGGADGFALPYDEDPGYSNMSAGGFGILFREERDNYITGNAYWYKTGGTASWRAKYGAYGATMIGSDGGNITFETAPANTTAPHTLSFTPRLVIKQGGNVGIGTTSPSQKLHVSGNARVTGAYYDSNNSAGTSGQVLSSTATGTDWVSLSEISGVDGTGTENYIAKWSDADTITNSVIYDDGTNVGINDISTGKKLSVKVGSSNDDGIVIKDENGNIRTDLTLAGSAGVREGRIKLIDNSGNTNVQIHSDTVSYFNGGNVGIGTTSPSYQLEVNNTVNENLARFYRTNSATSISHLVSTGRPQTRYSYDSQQTWYVGNNVGTFGIGTGYLASTTPILNITSTGNVGIGTTSPDNKLEVQGVISSADAGLQKATFANVGNDLVLTANADATNVTAKMLFNSSGAGGGTVSTKMIIDGSGNVGIGTTSPNTKLNVAGSSADGGGVLTLENTTTATGSADYVGKIQFYGNDSGTGANGVRASIMADIQGYNGETDLVFSTANTSSSESEAMRIDQAGNVGIGTTAPSTTLHVAGSSAVITLQDNNSSGNTSTTRIDFRDNGTFGTIGQIGFIGTDDLEIKNTHTGNILLNGGNVGIGTTSPDYKLDVSGAVGINTYIHHNGDDDTFIGYSANDTFDVNAGGVKQLSVTSDNVNITDTLSYTYPTATNEYNGEIVTFGSFNTANGAIAEGDVIVYTTAGLNSGWMRAQGNTTYSKGMLGIAMGTSASDGILIKGFARNAAFASGGLGSPLYLSPTSAGDTTSTVPGSTNNIVRIVGYMLNPTNDEIFFDPDKSWVQVS